MLENICIFRHLAKIRVQQVQKANSDCRHFWKEENFGTEIDDVAEI